MEEPDSDGGFGERPLSDIGYVPYHFQMPCNRGQKSQELLADLGFQQGRRSQTVSRVSF